MPDRRSRRLLLLAVEKLDTGLQRRNALSVLKYANGRRGHDGFTIQNAGR